MIAPILDAIPGFLTTQSRWVLWREILRRGKKTKAPFTAANTAASSTNSRTWETFPTIADVFQRNPSVFDGFGIVLGDLGSGEHFCGIDLDSCLDENGDIADWALPIVSALRTYVETSPSESGLKSFFRCRANDAAELRAAFGIAASQWGSKRSVTSAANGKEHGPAIEVYLGPGRYFTVTGKHRATSPADVALLDRAALLRVAELVAKATAPPTANSTSSKSSNPGRDNSRSAIAFRLAAQLLHENSSLTFDEMCEALRAHPDTAGWCREKGDSYSGRGLKKIWDKILPGTQPPPCDPTEDAVAAAFAKTYTHRLAYDYTEGSWFAWINGRWVRDGRNVGFHAARLFTRAIRENLQEPPRTLTKISFSDAVERAARADPRLALSHEVWDTDPWLLGTPDGVVDLRTGQMFPARPDFYISRCTSVSPALPDTPAPIWTTFLKSATKDDQEFQDCLYRLGGYVLTGDVSEEVLNFFYGPGGNGKGTFLVTLTGIMGEYAVSVPIETFTAGSRINLEYYRAQIAGARLVTASETEAQATWAEAQIKEITGNDMPLSGRHPRGRPFTFRPQAKIIIIGNHAPKLKGRTPAMERRLRISPFVNQPSKPDDQLKEKLKAEYPAILRLMIEGCLKWQKERLGTAPVIRKATSSYFEQQDAFGRWMDEQCILDKSLSLKPGLLMADFNAWAKANSEDAVGNNAFAEMIDRKPGLERIKTNGVRYVKGIGLRRPASADRDDQ